MPLRPLVLFLLRALALYAVLMAPWPGLRDGYTTAFRGGCRLLNGDVGARGHVLLLPLDPRAPQDTMFLLRKRGSNAAVRNGVDSRHTGYLPAALVVGLVVATPLSWRRRAVALLAGLVGIHVFVAARVVASTYSDFVVFDGIALVDAGPWSRAAVSGVTALLTEPVTSIVAAVVLWGLATFRRGDLALLGLAGGPQRDGPGAPASPGRPSVP